MNVDLPAAISLYLDYHRARGLSLLSLKQLRYQLRELSAFLDTGAWPEKPDTLIAWQASQRVGRTTMHHKIKAVRAFFSWAFQMGYIHVDVARSLVVPRRPKYLPQILDDDQVERLIRGQWAPAYGERDLCLVERDRLLVRTFMLTGLRRAEMCAVAVGDLDTTHRRLRVRGKGERDRVVPLPAGLDLRYLVAGRRATDPLFQRRDGGRLDPNAISYVFTRKVSPAVGARVTPHMLRHSYATYLCRRGVPLRQIQRLLGHSSLATTQLYLDVTAADLEQAVGVLDGLCGD